MNGAILAHSDEYVQILLENLSNPSLNRAVKPPLLAVFGDIASATGAQFERYLRFCMDLLTQAAKVTVPVRVHMAPCMHLLVA